MPFRLTLRIGQKQTSKGIGCSVANSLSARPSEPSESSTSESRQMSRWRPWSMDGSASVELSERQIPPRFPLTIVKESEMFWFWFPLLACVVPSQNSSGVRSARRSKELAPAPIPRRSGLLFWMGVQCKDWIESRFLKHGSTMPNPFQRAPGDRVAQAVTVVHGSYHAPAI